MAATAAAGRKAQARHLRVAAGRSPGRDSGGRKIPDPVPFVRAAPPMPADMSAPAKAEWKRIVPQLDRLNLLTTVSRSSLVAYCEAWATFVEARNERKKRGIVVENRSTRRDGTEAISMVANPAISIQLQAQREMRSWCAEFGLTPSSEGKLSLPEVPDGEEGIFSV